MLSIISTASTVHKALFRALVRPCAPVRLSAALVERQFFQATNIVSGLGLESAYCGSFSPSAWIELPSQIKSRVSETSLPSRLQNLRATRLSFSHEGYRPSTSPLHVLKPQSMPRRSPLPLMTKAGKLGTRVVVLPLRAQNGHVFALNGFDHAQKGFACGIGALLSRIGTFRPDHQAVFMRRKFRGHIKPVL